LYLCVRWLSWNGGITFKSYKQTEKTITEINTTTTTTTNNNNNNNNQQHADPNTPTTHLPHISTPSGIPSLAWMSLSHLAAASDDGYVYIWKVEQPEEQQEQAEEEQRKKNTQPQYTSQVRVKRVYI